MDEPLANPDALTPGVVQAVAGDLAYRCIKRATALALSGEVKATATAPLNKEALHLAGITIRVQYGIAGPSYRQQRVLYREAQGYPYFDSPSHCVNSWIL